MIGSDSLRYSAYQPSRVFLLLAACKETVTQTTVLVSIRYPLNVTGVQTIKRAVAHADQFDDAHLFILHVNLLHKGEHVNRTGLRHAVEQEVGSLANVSYHIRDAFLLEEAILNEAYQQDADYVVIGKSRRGRWRRLLSDFLGIDLDLETFLHQQLGAKLLVVEENESPPPHPLIPV